MKLRKHISRLLALALLTNNIYFNKTSANTEIPNRYQTLEGEYITIDDSTEGELHEIEIFGNTVQDENNLEDIQSVGDLYVDEDGNPILDSQGREQYKIDIISGNKLPIKDEVNNSKLNTVYNLKYKDSIDFSTKNYTKIGDCVQLHFKIKKLSPSYINKDTVYNNIASSFLGSNGGYEVSHITIDEWNNLEVGESIEKTFIRQLNKEEEFRDHLKFVFRLRDKDATVVDNESYTGDFIIENIDFSIVNSNLDYTYQESKQTILLPTQLQKVGDVVDRLYWDNEKGRYVIEKNISNYIVNGTTNSRKHTAYGNYIKYQISVPNPGDYHGKFHPALINGIVKGYPQQSNFNENDSLGGGYYFEPSSGFGSAIFIKVSSSILNTDNMSEINAYLSFNNLEVLYKSATPELIETDIASKLKIPTYENKTYIYTESENGINPILKVTVDKIEDAAQDAVDIIESMESNDTLTVATFSLARSLVNQMEESLLKDQLQAKLNSISSLNDLALDRKSVTANLDVYIKCENMLSMSLDTNSVTFEGYSGTEPMEKLKAINITVNSSLPYNINAYIPAEISNADGDNRMALDVLNIRESDEAVYKQFENTVDKIVLKENCEKGNNINHSIDLKLDSSDAHTPDVYKAVIKLEAEQK